MTYEATIRQELAKLKPEVRKPWRTFDALPYLHATDDPKAKMYDTPVVGRFDYLPAMGYIKALHPVAVEALLAELDRSRSSANPWKEAIDAELINSALDCTGPGDDPKVRLHQLISWNVEMALDPQVSKEAADLVAKQPAPWKFEQGEFEGQILATKPDGTKFGIQKKELSPEVAQIFNAMAEALSK